MPLSRREFVTLMSSAAAALGSRSLTAQTLRVRKEIRSLSSADIDVLKAGVGAMQALPKTDFRAWMYQSGVHAALPGEDSGVADASTYWNQCVHFGLHFLSWHRWELLFIEEIMALMSDHCAFALPYWDYIANGFLPDPLRSPPDASNPLFHASRAPALNSATGALSGLSANALGQTGFSPFSSILYGNPHSAVHGQVGGDMASVPTAARDPVFYLHHCNIDRYWECWLRQGGGRSNPGSPWPEQTFPFRTTTGHRLAIVGDGGKTADLGYTYDNLPCGNPLDRHLAEILRDLRFIEQKPVIPRPLPDPPPWIDVLAFESFVLDGRPLALVIPHRDLTALRDLWRSERTMTVALEGLELQPAALKDAFFFQVWFAPRVNALRSASPLSLEDLGSFSAFDLSDHSRTVERAAAPHGVTFALSKESQRSLLELKEDAAIVIGRRGLVGKDGRELPFDSRQGLLKVGRLRLQIGSE